MKKLSWLTFMRLLASGALLGVVVAGVFGVDMSSGASPSIVSGLAGATGSALLLKLVHII